MAAPETAAKPAPQEPLPQLKLDNQLCFPLYACARRIVNLYTPHLKPLGLTYTQYLALMALWEQQPMTVGSLCRRLLLDNGTVTPLLKKMEGSGWICRERSREDERIVQIRLTDAGAALRDRARDIPACVGGMIPLQPEEAFALYGMLRTILERMEGNT